MNPCFLFRPDIFARACWRKLRPRPQRCLVKTAWGDWLEVEPRRFIGANVYMRGVHELAVCEVLWRLTGAADTVVDAGANIGVMTSLLSRRVGEQGRVLAFEAHPEVFRRLERNVARWERRRVDLFQRALSAKVGVVHLREGAWFSKNEGTARITTEEAAGRSYQVGSVRLDDMLPPGNCGVVKIDIEGHELEMLAGASSALKEGRLRDLVLEATIPGPIHQLLLGCNYHVYEIHHSLRGPKLAAVNRRSGQTGCLADYLATLEPRRAEELVAPPGWHALSGQRG